MLAPLILLGCALSPKEGDFALTTAQRADQAAKAKEVTSLLDDSRHTDYLLLDPLSQRPKEDAPPDMRPKILNWRIEGSAQVSGSALASLRSALSSAIADGNPLLNAMCFNPRHALRINKPEGDVVIVICFECGKGFVSLGGEISWFQMGGEQTTFDEVAQRLGISKS